MNDVILSLTGVSKIYPGTVALHNVDLEVVRGETHGIIGKNGAGKSTLVGIVAGLVKPTTGTFAINGRSYHDLSRIASRQERVSIVPQEPQLVENATIAENLFLPDYPVKRGGLAVDWKRLFQRGQEVLDRSDLALKAHTLVGDLGVGLQQIIMMLKASYVEDSQIIILDEAFASLSEREEQIFFRIMRERRQAGCTILHISHRIDELLQVCDRMTVLRDGHSVATVHRDEVDHRSLAALIVGGAGAATVAPGVSSATSPPAAPPAAGVSLWPVELSVEGFSRAGAFRVITFSVRKGEILGIAGLIGSGRTEVMKAIIGLDRADAGTIRRGDSAAPAESIRSPKEALQRGIVYLPEERDAEGLVDGMSVKSNTVMSALKRITRGLFLNRPAERTLVGDLRERLEIKYASMDQEVRELSGGNRQKVVVSRVFSTEPAVYLLDEPTKGIDIAAREGLLRIIRDELARDAAVVMTAPGLEELMRLSDRIVVLHRGELVAEFQGPDYREEEIFQAMQGASRQGAAPQGATIHKTTEKESIQT